MSYNKEALLALPDEEKIALAEELWSSVEDEHLPVTNEEITFAEERLKMHNESPTDGMSVEEFKKVSLKNMAYKIIIKPLVFSDVEDAFNWYNKQVKGLGTRFYNQFWITIDSIQTNPFAYSFLKASIRRCRMETFPYKIYYIIEGETIFI